MRGRRVIPAAALAYLIGMAMPLGAQPAPDLGTDDERQAGKIVYDKYCAQCHGADGAGLGIAAPRLHPEPRDFTSGKYKIRSTPTGYLPTDEDEAAEATDEAADDGLRLIARDAANNPVMSRFDWTDDATARLLRVPPGFMRDRTQKRVEELAEEKGLGYGDGTGETPIDLALVEEGIQHGLRMMAEMIGQQEAEKKKAAASSGADAPDGAAEECPVEHDGAADGASDGAGDEHPRLALNEVSVMSEMERKRRSLSGDRADNPPGDE